MRQLRRVLAFGAVPSLRQAQEGKGESWMAEAKQPTPGALRYLAVFAQLAGAGGTIRSVELSRAMGVSRPGVSKAVKLLQEQALVERTERGKLRLTASGRRWSRIASRQYDILYRYLVETLRVDEKTARADALTCAFLLSDQSRSRLETPPEPSHAVG